MRVWSLSVIAVAAIAAGCGGEPPVAQQSAPAAAPKVRPTVLGAHWQGQTGTLRLLDALTLRPVGPPGAKVPAGLRARSPDGLTIAFGSGGGSGEVRLVDVRTLRAAGRIDLGGAGWVGEILWESRDRMLVLVGGPDLRVALVDPLARRVIRSFRLDGALIASEARAARLAALLGPAEGIGPARVAVFDAVLGHLGTVTLPEIRAGMERIEHAEDSYAMRERRPGLAISPDGTRALVVPAGNRVAEIELESLGVTYHNLSEPVSLLGRLRAWLDPEAQAKVLEGPSRRARWLGEDYVAVTGMDVRGVERGEWDAEPVGLRLIDTRSWSVRTLAESVSWLTATRDLLLAFGGGWPEGSTGTGLLAFGPDGEQRFHALGEHPVSWVETSWPYVYVPAGAGRRYTVVDLRTGAVLARPLADPSVSVLGTG